MIQNFLTLIKQGSHSSSMAAILGSRTSFLLSMGGIGGDPPVILASRRWGTYIYSLLYTTHYM